MNSRTCGSCEFFEPDGSEWGECRFDPPRVMVSEQLMGSSSSPAVWPRVQQGQWCGRWGRKAEPHQPKGCGSASLDVGRGPLLCELMLGHGGVHRALRGTLREVSWAS